MSCHVEHNIKFNKYIITAQKYNNRQCSNSDYLNAK